jgi:hypothetical protein
MTIVESGNYSIKHIEEGYYNLVFHSIDSRPLKIDSIHIIKDSMTYITTTYPPFCKFIYSKNYKPNCPYNHSDGIIKIVYGLPTAKTMANAKKGLVHLGGCLTTYCDPKYYCTLHKLEF